MKKRTNRTPEYLAFKRINHFKLILMKKMHTILLLLAMICVSSMSFGQSIFGSFESQYTRYQKNQVFDGLVINNWDDVAWKGERLYKQIVLWSASNLSDVSYNVGELSSGSHTIPATNINLLFANYIKTDPVSGTCRAYENRTVVVEVADRLSVEEINSISADDPVKIMVTIDIPETTPAGLYTGIINVAQGGTTLNFSVSINVVNWVLPDPSQWVFELNLWQHPNIMLGHYNNANPSAPIEMWSDEHFALIEPAYKNILAKSGQKVITTMIRPKAMYAQTQVVWKKTIAGEWEYDFTVFDKYVSTLMSWGIDKQIDCFSPTAWNRDVIIYWDEATNEIVELDAPINGTVYNTRWNHFLTVFKNHLDTKGWFDKAVIHMDEIHDESMLTGVIDMIHANNPNWKIGVTYDRPLSTALSNKIYDASGTINVARTKRRKGKLSTFYTSCNHVKPNNYVTPDKSPVEMSWMAWHALNRGYDGYLKWAFDSWRLNDPYDARDGVHTSGAYHFIYRNHDMTYSTSYRMELLRDGIEDFEKVKILKATLTSAEKKAEIDNIIGGFDLSSVGNALDLVIEAQGALKSIVADFTLNIEEVIPTSLKTNVESNHLLKLYPNPVEDYLIVEIENATTIDIEIYDLSSRLLIKDKLYKSGQINVSNLKQGVYLVRMLSNSHETIGKIYKR